MSIDICPQCGGDTKVIETRPLKQSKRRRRECLKCQYRFSTWEYHQCPPEEVHRLLLDMHYRVSQLEQELREALQSIHLTAPTAPEPENNSGIDL